MKIRPELRLVLRTGIYSNAATALRAPEMQSAAGLFLNCRQPMTIAKPLTASSEAFDAILPTIGWRGVDVDVTLDPGGFWYGRERTFFTTTIDLSGRLLRAVRPAEKWTINLLNVMGHRRSP